MVRIWDNVCTHSYNMVHEYHPYVLCSWMVHQSSMERQLHAALNQRRKVGGAPPLKTAMVTTKTSMDVHLENRNCYYNMLKPIIAHM